MCSTIYFLPNIFFKMSQNMRNNLLFDFMKTSPGFAICAKHMKLEIDLRVSFNFNGISEFIFS